MNLFDVIPGSFFSVLSSPNKELYVEALLKLNEMLRYSVNIDLKDYLSNLNSLLEIREYIAENSDEIEVPSMPNNKKARLILDRFKNTGWIFIENQDGTFKEIISLHQHSIKTLKLIEQLSNPTIKEYNSLVFSTYSSLKQAISEDNDRIYDALINAKNNSIKLMDELKTLFHSIRDYHNNVLTTENINKLLENQFDDYQLLVDKIYHPIKTMDSIHRYSTPIINFLRDISTDEILTSMAKKAVNIKFYESEQDAIEGIYNEINIVINNFNNIPKIVSEIDRKHTKYSSASMGKISNMLSGDRTIKGKLITLLSNYQQNESSQDTLLVKMQGAINANIQENLCKKSLWHKSVKRKRIVTEPLKVEKIDSKKSDEKFKKLLKKMNLQYTDKSVNEYIMGILNGKDKIRTSDIEINGDGDFIYLILATVKAKHQKMEYSICFDDGAIENNGYKIPNATILRKGE